jgi:hypothetical protein
MAASTSNLPTQNLLLINAVCSGNVELTAQLLSTCTALEPDKVSINYLPLELTDHTGFSM